MELLGLPKFSGLVVLIDTTSPVEVLRIAAGAALPAHVCIKNTSTGTVYLKTMKRDEGGAVSSTNYGVALDPGESYDFGGCPPRGVSLFALATVALSALAVEANWTSGDEADDV